MSKKAGGEVLCIIPARGGSKGVPRKNIRRLGNKPVLAYSIAAAKESGVIQHLIVSTEDSEIKEVAYVYGAKVVDRPFELASDSATNESVMEHALHICMNKQMDPEFVALIQPSSPFLPPSAIVEAVDAVKNGVFDTAITVFSPLSHEFKWRKREDSLEIIPEHDIEHRPFRQHMELPLHENGAFYITRTSLFLRSKNRFGGSGARVAGVLMSELDSLQIDDPYHFWLANQYLQYRVPKFFSRM